MKAVGYAEAVSFLVLLLVAVPLKHLADSPMLVRVVGPIHGVLFMGYAVLVALTARRRGWSFGDGAALVGAALLPLGPFFTHRAPSRSSSGEDEARAGEPS